MEQPVLVVSIPPGEWAASFRGVYDATLTYRPQQITRVGSDFYRCVVGGATGAPSPTNSGWQYIGSAGGGGGLGSEGAEGKEGKEGKEGPAGPAGPEGPKGAKGTTGLTGAPGAAGAEGKEGKEGPQGVAGPEGKEGPKGATGLEGPKGTTGLTGAEGPAGVKGADGVAGAKGADGVAGAKGADGATGPEGKEGKEGKTGPEGPKGLTGNTGPEATAVWKNVEAVNAKLEQTVTIQVAVINGMVFFRGLGKVSAEIAAKGILFTLPLAARPAAERHMAWQGSITASTTNVLNVKTNGEVEAVLVQAAGKTPAFDSLSFSL